MQSKYILLSFLLALCTWQHVHVDPHINRVHHFPWKMHLSKNKAWCQLLNLDVDYYLMSIYKNEILIFLTSFGNFIFSVCQIYSRNWLFFCRDLFMFNCKILSFSAFKIFDKSKLVEEEEFVKSPLSKQINEAFVRRC